MVSQTKGRKFEFSWNRQLHKQVRKPHPNVIKAANRNVVQVDFKKRRVIVREQ